MESTVNWAAGPSVPPPATERRVHSARLPTPNGWVFQTSVDVTLLLLLPLQPPQAGTVQHLNQSDDSSLQVAPFGPPHTLAVLP
jgi:hypothetical protein